MPADRLFIAIPLPASVREQLFALYEPMRSVAWTRPEQLHLTLRFLGDVEAEWGEKLESALSRAQVEPFLLPVAGLGAFPPRGTARVLWVGVGHGHPRLHQLRQQIDDALMSGVQAHPARVSALPGRGISTVRERAQAWRGGAHAETGIPPSTGVVSPGGVVMVSRHSRDDRLSLDLTRDPEPLSNGQAASYKEPA